MISSTQELLLPLHYIMTENVVILSYLIKLISGKLGEVVSTSYQSQL